MKPNCGINSLHNLQGHSEQTHLLILFLKVSRLTDSLNSLGTSPQILGPRYDKDSVPWYTEVTFRLSKKLLFRKLYVASLCTNTSSRILGDIPLYDLNISVANVCKFL